MTREALILKLALIPALVGCGAVDGLVPAPPATKRTASKVEELAGGGTKKSGDATPGPRPSKDGEESSIDGDEDFADLDENANEGPTAEELAEQCGGIDLDKPDEVLLEQNLPGLPIVQRGRVLVINYEVTVVGTLAITSSARESVSTTSFEVVSARPALARNRAEQEVAALAGPVTTAFVDVDERFTLVDRHESWKGIVCVVQPAIRVVNEVGGGLVVANLDPPIPTSVSPMADEVRYDEEVPKELVWTNLVATVESSTNAAVRAGTSYNGTVTVRPIEPNFTHTLDDGTAVQITSDRAYEVVIDFGNPQIADALGLHPKTQFYIDHAKRAFKAIRVETADANVPPAVFVYD